MCGLRSLSLASGAMVWGRHSYRLHSTRGRPPAPLGGRILTNPDDVFQHNMWDHVQWSAEEESKAREKAEENSSTRIPVEEQGKYDTDACRYWDGFYQTHQNKFFKDRKWLFLEFPELLPVWSDRAGSDGGGRGPPRAPDQEPHVCGGRGAQSERRRPAARHAPDDAEADESRPSWTLTSEAAQQTDSFPGQHATFPGQHATLRILEVGCGAGNSVFPIVSSIKGAGGFLYCCDFSPCAVRLVKEHPAYDPTVCHAFTQDVCEEGASFPFPPQSLDVVLLVFVLSSIQPRRVQGVVKRLCGFLKPGGVFLFRDYGRYDLTQLRFKKGQCLSENFYTRGDGTCVYFFTKDEVHRLFSDAGLEEIQNLEDKRLQVNRGKKVVMHRVWMQGKFRKPLPPS